MKRIITIVIALVILCLFSAYNKAQQEIDDVFKMLGIPETEAMQIMKDNLLYASLQTPSSGKYKSIPATKRAGIVQQLGNYVKKQFKTAEVAADYAAYRESMMPGRQEGIDVKARIEEIQRDIKNTQEDLKTAPADMKKLYEETITLLKKQLQILQDPSHPDHAMHTGKVILTPEEQEEINKQIKAFSKEYPEDIQQYIKLKLKEFLELTSDIDFSAKLIQRNGKWKFENPVYEGKDANWKKCFRAGKETIDAARSFAQQWLSEIK